MKLTNRDVRAIAAYHMIEKAKELLCEEDGDEIVTPMPNTCQRFSCREHHLALVNVNGFMCCSRCKCSYGAVTPNPTGR